MINKQVRKKHLNANFGSRQITTILFRTPLYGFNLPLLKYFIKNFHNSNKFSLCFGDASSDFF